MNYQHTASEVLRLVGGKENIAHLEHCSTRLRLTLHDNKKIALTDLEKVDGVIGVRINVQCQVIIGNDVVEVFEQLSRLVGTLSTSSTPPESEGDRSWYAVALDFVISIFQPLIPAIAGGGVLKSLLLLLDMLGWLSSTSPTYQVLNNIGSAPLYFLPLLVAITTANKLKVNTLVAVSAVATLVLPAMTKQLADGSSLFGLPLQNIAYPSQVFPAILCVLFYAQAEKLFTRYSPKSVRIFLVPMLSLLVTVPVTLLVLGPLGYTLGAGFANVILALFNQFGMLATALLAAVLPFMVATGMHKAMIPYAVTSMGQFGKEMLYLPASLAHNIAESGACFAVACRTRDKGLRSTAISAGISALFGITEPALYGVTLLNKRVLYSVMLASLIGGATAGFLAISAFALVGPGLASLSMFIAPNDPSNLLYAGGVLVLSFALSFAAAFALWREPQSTATPTAAQAAPANPAPLAIAQTQSLHSPIAGRMIPLAEVNDNLFSRRIIGDGIAIIPTEGVLRAPSDGVIEGVFDKGHALNMCTQSGTALIFHIGLGTLRLEGDHFFPQVKAGQQVKAGDELIRFNLDALVSAGIDPVVVLIVTNGERYQVTPLLEHEQVSNQNVVMMVSEFA